MGAPKGYVHANSMAMSGFRFRKTLVGTGSAGLLASYTHAELHILCSCSQVYVGETKWRLETSVNED